MSKPFLVLTLCSCLISLCQAQSLNGDSSQGNSQSYSISPGEFQPNFQPSLTITKSSESMKIDGELDEDIWTKLVPVENFSEIFPGDQTQPAVELKGMMTYDEENLYVGIMVFDDPSSIRVNLSDRDEIWGDDYAGIVLDPNRDGQGMYFIAVNPIGIQGDSFMSPNNEDDNFDLLYHSSGQVTESGYQIEMAIPFKSLRFPDVDSHTWGATFWVTRPRESRNEYSWAAINRDNPCMSCQLGEINGILDIRSGRNLEILPSLTGAGGGTLNDPDIPSSGFNNERVTFNPSLNVKYGITSQLTADVTVNPDFSQIESDQAQINVNSTFALFYEERRPFFQEGAGLFDTEIRTVYTRAINDPIGAVKLTGRFGSVDVAYIGARDNQSPLLLPFEEESQLLKGGRSVSNIARIRHSFNNDSFVGVLLTDRRLDEGGSGSTVSVDAATRFWRKYTLSGQFVYSRTAEPNDLEKSRGLEAISFGTKGYTGILDGESFTGYASRIEFDRAARYWSFEGGYEAVSPTFRADNGFVRQNNSQTAYFWQAFTIYPERVIGFIDRIRPNMVVGSSWNFDGLQKSVFLRTSLSVQFKRQTFAQISWRSREENFAGIQFNGMTQLRGRINSNFSGRVNLGAEVSVGESIVRFLDQPEIGDSFEITAWGQFRPTSFISIQPRISFSQLTDQVTGEEFYSGYIARARVKYVLSRRFFLRTVFQYSEFSKSLEIDPLITYKLNPFTALHIGSTHELDQFHREGSQQKYFRQSDRQIFFKVQYLFR